MTNATAVHTGAAGRPVPEHTKHELHHIGNANKMQTNADVVVNHQSLMDAACTEPGRFKTDFVSPAGILKLTGNIVAATKTFNTCFDHSTGTEDNLGTDEFTVMMICPALTLLKGDGSYSTLDSKLAGFSMVQGSNQDTQFLDLVGFLDESEGYSMADIWGSQGEGVGERTFMWATSWQFKPIGPAAMATQVSAFVRTVPLASLWGETKLSIKDVV